MHDPNYSKENYFGLEELKKEIQEGDSGDLEVQNQEWDLVCLDLLPSHTVRIPYKECTIDFETCGVQWRIAIIITKRKYYVTSEINLEEPTRYKRDDWRE